MATVKDWQSVLFLCTGNFYRSRYAEAWFNYHAPRQGLLWRAESRGFRPHLEEAPLSPHAADRLKDREIPRLLTRRAPELLLESDLATATIIVALYESEHRPMMEERFPRWTGRTRYWEVPDIDEVGPRQALSSIEGEVDSLIQLLVRGHAPGIAMAVGAEF